MSKKNVTKNQKEAALLSWMRFFSATTEEEFEKAAEGNPDVAEAYEVLKELSADPEIRRRAEAREKELKDMRKSRWGHLKDD